jgi:hypothetical protein
MAAASAILKKIRTLLAVRRCARVGSKVLIAKKLKQAPLRLQIVFLFQPLEDHPAKFKGRVWQF